MHISLKITKHVYYEVSDYISRGILLSLNCENPLRYKLESLQDKLDAALDTVCILLCDVQPGSSKA
jgi:hypothetical protein